jgi:hypothetical protein
VNGDYYGDEQQQSGSSNAGTNGLFGSTRQANDGSSDSSNSDSSNEGNGPIGLLRRLFGRGNNRQ